MPLDNHNAPVCFDHANCHENVEEETVQQNEIINNKQHGGKGA